MSRLRAPGADALCGCRKKIMFFLLLVVTFSPIVVVVDFIWSGLPVVEAIGHDSNTAPTNGRFWGIHPPTMVFTQAPTPNLPSDNEDDAHHQQERKKKKKKTKRRKKHRKGNETSKPIVEGTSSDVAVHDTIYRNEEGDVASVVKRKKRHSRGVTKRKGSRRNSDANWWEDDSSNRRRKTSTQRTKQRRRTRRSLENDDNPQVSFQERVTKRVAKSEDSTVQRNPKRRRRTRQSIASLVDTNSKERPPDNEFNMVSTANAVTVKKRKRKVRHSTPLPLSKENNSLSKDAHDSSTSRKKNTKLKRRRKVHVEDSIEISAGERDERNASVQTLQQNSKPRNHTGFTTNTANDPRDTLVTGEQQVEITYNLTHDDVSSTDSGEPLGKQDQKDGENSASPTHRLKAEEMEVTAGTTQDADSGIGVVSGQIASSDGDRLHSVVRDEANISSSLEVDQTIGDAQERFRGKETMAGEEEFAWSTSERFHEGIERDEASAEVNVGESAPVGVSEEASADVDDRCERAREPKVVEITVGDKSDKEDVHSGEAGASSDNLEEFIAHSPEESCDAQIDSRLLAAPSDGSKPDDGTVSIDKAIPRNETVEESISCPASSQSRPNAALEIPDAGHPGVLEGTREDFDFSQNQDDLEEDDVLTFIGNVLQEDVRDWVDESTDDPNDGEGEVRGETMAVAGADREKAEEVAVNDASYPKDEDSSVVDNASTTAEEVATSQTQHSTPSSSATEGSTTMGRGGAEGRVAEQSTPHRRAGAISEDKHVCKEEVVDAADETANKLSLNSTDFFPLLDRSTVESSEDDDSDIKVSVVTWNLAEESPSEEDASFIRNFRKAGSDLVLISGQECENIKPRRTEGRRSREFRRLAIKMLGQQYVPIVLHLLGGIQFGLFAHKSFLNDIEAVSVVDVTCGIGNVFHNKGAIAAFLQVKARKPANPALTSNSNPTKHARSLRMMFVTAHMAAHVKNSDARDADYWRISSELEAQAPERFSPLSSVNGESTGSDLFDSMDRVFFCGDLNYRLDLPRELTEHTINAMTAHSSSESLRLDLLRHDQLIRTMAERRAFAGFTEGKITFAPTFKFDKESGDYDTSHKQRIPAWTDRILFKPLGTRVLEYTSVPNAKHSDHRPVYGTFRVGMQGKELLQKRRRNGPKQRLGQTETMLQ